MRTKNTCRYYCAVDKKERIVRKGVLFSTNFYKQKRVAIMQGEEWFDKDYIIIHWDFELPKKEGKE